MVQWRAVSGRCIKSFCKESVDSSDEGEQLIFRQYTMMKIFTKTKIHKNTNYCKELWYCMRVLGSGREVCEGGEGHVQTRKKHNRCNICFEDDVEVQGRTKGAALCIYRSRKGL